MTEKIKSLQPRRPDCTSRGEEKEIKKCLKLREEPTMIKEELRERENTPINNKIIKENKFCKFLMIIIFLI